MAHGDGSLLMGLGALATIAVRQPENLVHIVWDNAAYAMTGGQPSATGRRTAAEQGGAGEAGWIVGVYSVLLLLHLVPELLVERRSVSGAGGAVAGIPVDRRLAG